MSKISHIARRVAVNVLDLDDYELAYVALAAFADRLEQWGIAAAKEAGEDAGPIVERQVDLVRSIMPQMAQLDRQLLEILGDDPSHWEQVYPALQTASSEERTAIVRKTPNKKEWCVKSENNPDWSGGCYPSESQADDRLGEVEAAKHAKGKGEKRKSSIVSRVAGASLTERLFQLDDAIEKAEEAGAKSDELEKLRDERAEILDAMTTVLIKILSRTSAGNEYEEETGGDRQASTRFANFDWRSYIKYPQYISGKSTHILDTLAELVDVKMTGDKFTDMTALLRAGEREGLITIGEHDDLQRDLARYL